METDESCVCHETNQLVTPLFKYRTDKTMGYYKFNQQQVLNNTKEEAGKKMFKNQVKCKLLQNYRK